MQLIPEVRRGISYSELEILQHNLTEKVKTDHSKAYLLISEPLPTFTCGRSGTSEELLWKDPILCEKKIAVHHVQRGGHWTYHGPGQIVIYPILHLRSWGYSSKAVKQFMSDLREAIGSFLISEGVTHEKREEPFGIYASGRKLASFGLQFTAGISNHGIALYVAPQHSFFLGIDPCGVRGGLTTSLQELGSNASWEEATEKIICSIKTVLNTRKTQ